MKKYTYIYNIYPVYIYHIYTGLPTGHVANPEVHRLKPIPISDAIFKLISIRNML